MKVDKSKIKALFMEGLSCRIDPSTPNNLEVGFMAVSDYIKGVIPPEEYSVINYILNEMNDHINDIGLPEVLNNFLKKDSLIPSDSVTIVQVNTLISECEYNNLVNGGDSLGDCFELSWR